MNVVVREIEVIRYENRLTMRTFKKIAERIDGEGDGKDG